MGKFKISYRPVTVVKWFLTPSLNVELLMYRTFIPSIKYIKKIDVRIIKFDISYLGQDR